MGIFELDRPVSINDRVIVEAYQKEDLKHEVKSGFVSAIVQQTNVKGLTLLMDAKLRDGTVIPKGHKAYIKERDLHSQPWAKVVLKSDLTEGNFLIIDLANVEFFAPN